MLAANTHLPNFHKTYKIQYRSYLSCLLSAKLLEYSGIVQVSHGVIGISQSVSPISLRGPNWDLHLSSKVIQVYIFKLFKPEGQSLQNCLSDLGLSAFSMLDSLYSTAGWFANLPERLASIRDLGPVCLGTREIGALCLLFGLSAHFVNSIAACQWTHFLGIGISLFWQMINDSTDFEESSNSDSE